jgi:hypothetical protein
MARAGSALGVDISASAIERARELAQAHGVHMSSNGVWFDSRAWIISARRH